MDTAEKLFRQLTDEEKQAYKRLCAASSSEDLGRCQPSWQKLASVIADRADVPIAPKLVSRIVTLSDEKARSMQQLFKYIKEFSDTEVKAEPVVAPKLGASESFPHPRNLNQATSEFFRNARQQNNDGLIKQFDELIHSEKGDDEYPLCKAFLNSLTSSIINKVDLLLPRDGDHVVPFIMLLSKDIFKVQSEMSIMEENLIQEIISYVRNQVKNSLYEEIWPKIPLGISPQEAAWKVDYVSKTDTLLRSAISSMYKQSRVEQKAYKNFCAIIQGSGTGKSRLVDKLAESVFTIPLVLRPVNDTSGYPHGDTFGRGPVLNLFCKNFPSVTHANRYYLLFMLKMVSYAGDWINGYLEEGHGTTTMAADWREYLGPPCSTNRIRMFEQANDPSIPKGFEGIWDISETIFSGTIQPLVEIFFKAIATKVEHDTRINPLFVFYFDEAHHLTDFTVTEKAQEPKRTAYQCLCRAFTYMLRAPVFGLFLSTSSQLSQFSPSTRNFRPLRVLTPLDGESDENMHAPFVELPFDFWKQTRIVVEGTHTAEEICSLQFMVRFGRPLFWTFVESKVEPAQVMEMAMLKLRLRSEGGGYYDNSNMNGIISPQLIPLLAARVDFTFESNRDEAVCLEGLLVASTMRTIYSIPQHMEYLHGGYPSEPFLAEAAARVMFNHFKFCQTNIEAVIEKYKDDLPTAVEQWFSRGLIERGQRGELVARLFCTLAHDIAILKKMPQLNSRVSFSEMVPVVDFLEALIAKDLIKNVLDTRPANLDGKRLRDAFKNSYVHFTQFVKAGHKSIITEEAAYFLFTRGAAIQGYGNIPSTDLVIPVWISGKGNPDRSSMSAIFIQVKNRLKGEEIFIDAVGEFEFFGEPACGQEDDRAYIAIAMQLGIPESDKVSSRPRRFSSRQGEKLHPCYELSLSGCSSDIYNVVSRDREAAYSSILAAGGILPEHPRQEKDFFDSVKRMKPLWEPDFELFNWAEANGESRLETLPDDEDEGDVEMEDIDENAN